MGSKFYSDLQIFSFLAAISSRFQVFQLFVCEHVYTGPDVNSNRFEISNRFGISFRLHGNLHEEFTAATFQAIARLYCTCTNDIF